MGGSLTDYTKRGFRKTVIKIQEDFVMEQMHCCGGGGSNNCIGDWL